MKADISTHISNVVPFSNVVLKWDRWTEIPIDTFKLHMTTQTELPLCEEGTVCNNGKELCKQCSLARLVLPIL